MTESISIELLARELSQAHEWVNNFPKIDHDLCGEPIDIRGWLNEALKPFDDLLSAAQCQEFAPREPYDHGYCDLNTDSGHSSSHGLG